MMYNIDDEDLQTYFLLNIDEDSASTANKNCDAKYASLKQECIGVYCRACNDYNKYAVPDNIINDSKFTCWSCMNHPERKRKGLTSDKIKELEKYYKKNYG